MAKLKEVVKPGPDVYTGLLGLSLAAMIVGCILLYLDYSSYDKSPTPLKIDVPGAVKTQESKAQPRTAPAEKKEEKAEEKKEGTSLPNVPERLPVAVVTDPVPSLEIPTLPGIDDKVKQAGGVEPQPLPPIEAPKLPDLPAAKPSGSEGPPVSVKPYSPN